MAELQYLRDYAELKLTNNNIGESNNDIDSQANYYWANVFTSNKTDANNYQSNYDNKKNDNDNHHSKAKNNTIRAAVNNSSTDNQRANIFATNENANHNHKEASAKVLVWMLQWWNHNFQRRRRIESIWKISKICE